jgi:Flp pilus assembly protein TadD
MVVSNRPSVRYLSPECTATIVYARKPRGGAGAVTRWCARLAFALHGADFERILSLVGKKNRGKQSPSQATRVAGQTTRAANESAGLLRFIQQLMKEEQFPEAIRAAQTLIEHDPINPLSHAVMGSLMLQVNQPEAAIRRFEMAVRFGMDKDPEIFRGLAITNTLSGYPIHGLQAARACLQVGASESQQGACQAVITATENVLTELIGKHAIDAETAEQAALLIEQSNRALRNEDFDRAKTRAIEATKVAPAWPFVWNNLAVLLFGDGDVDGALEAYEEAERSAAIPDPSIFLGRARLFSVVGRNADVAALVDAMIADPAAYGADTSDLAKGQALLDRDQAVLDLLLPGHEAGEKQTISSRYDLGAAAANLGNPDLARAAWRNLAREGLAQVRPYVEILGRREEPPTLTGRFPYLSAIELAPRKILDTIFKEGQSDPNAVDLTGYVARFPRLPEAMCEPLAGQSQNARLAVELLLRLPDPAVAAVARFARSRVAGDSERLYAHLALRGAGFVDPAEPASVWIGGKRRDWVLPAIRLRVVPPSEQSEEVRSLFAEGHAAQQANDAARAVEIYTRVLALDPDSKDAEHNLGTALMVSQRVDEGEQHLRRALELDEGYVLARANLAGLEMARGNLAAAHELIAPLEQRVDFAVEEAAAYLSIRGDLAVADQEPAQAEILFHAVLAYDPENRQANERLARLAQSTARQAS